MTRLEVFSLFRLFLLSSYLYLPNSKILQTGGRAEAASVEDKAKYRDFAKHLLSLAQMVEDTHVVHSNNTNKPWVAYRVAAKAFGRCNKKLNTKDDVKTLQSVGDVIADLYMEYRTCARNGEKGRVPS